jgi:hypothetical protein
MTRVATSMDVIIARMKPLPRRHRIAHLRALIRHEPDGSIRRDELAALLRAQWTARPANENRAP